MATSLFHVDNPDQVEGFFLDNPDPKGKPGSCVAVGR